MGPIKPTCLSRLSTPAISRGCVSHFFHDHYTIAFSHQTPYRLTSVYRRYSSNAKSDSRPKHDPKYEEFYKYQGGRWLWDEEKDMGLRYKEFNRPRQSGQIDVNISARLKTASTTVFRLTMDNGVVAIATLPYLIDGNPAYYSTASTAATMEFVRTVLGIPVHRVLAWEADGENPVGSEYILAEEARGTQLIDAWPNMGRRDQVAVIQDLVSIHRKLLSVTFNRYGSLYFSDSKVKGTPAEIRGFATPAVQQDVMDKFVIGPTTESGFWFKERAKMNIDRGPYYRVTPVEYALAVGQREIDWMNQFANSREVDIDPDGPPTEENLSTKAHLSLLNMYMRIAPMLLPEDPELVASSLWNPHLHGDNVFLEGNRISAISGWNHTWAGPLFTEASPPAFVKIEGDGLTLEYPENYKDLEEDEKREIDKKVSQSVFRYAYQEFVSMEVPQLDRLFNFEFCKIRAWPVSLCASSWGEDDICRFREGLMKIQRRWEFLGIEGSIPYSFSDEELKAQADAATKFNETQDFLDMISHLVDRNGWTSKYPYPQALELLAEVGREVLQSDDVSKSTKAQFQEWIDRESELKGEKDVQRPTSYV
ncbi:hypothetical protein AJ79_01232 [Helicocarpus griseus UAMH5409]|uniref:Aminoglycoside phosphotransferase domain-containing protein n=1 Tax=Helicocarpus griseus UAMH5409 TaxID=1447875 RepID=A0A2B7Y8V1_9EURO|nr:hypothetical protein AJ79_01232 [Helicocarpus griseus UAMH5409]